MDVLLVCLLKIVPEKGNLSRNFEKLLSVLQSVRDPKVDVFVTSECYLDGYVSTEKEVTKENIGSYGVTEDYLNRISTFTSNQSAWFILGCIENTDEGSKNAVFVFNRKGKIVGQYYKVHCLARDRELFISGSKLPVFESDFGKFGVMICADRSWPETVRTLALKGARIIFNPSYGGYGKGNECKMRTRSFESEVYICFVHPYESLITNLLGEVEAHLVSNVDGYLIHKIDLKAVEAARSQEGLLRNLKPEVYFLGEYTFEKTGL